MQKQLQIFLIRSLVVFALLFIGCAGDKFNSSPGSTRQNTNIAKIGESMIIEGKIFEVMESWPLQLTLKTQTGRYHVELLTETTIVREGETVNPGMLKPELKVRVEGQRSVSNKIAIIAHTIEILSENK